MQAILLVAGLLFAAYLLIPAVGVLIGGRHSPYASWEGILRESGLR